MPLLKEIFDKTNEMLTLLIMEAKYTYTSSKEERLQLFYKGIEYAKYIRSIDKPELFDSLSIPNIWRENYQYAMNLIGRYNHYVGKIEEINDEIIDACLSSTFDVSENFLHKIESIARKMR